MTVSSSAPLRAIVAAIAAWLLVGDVAIAADGQEATRNLTVEQRSVVGDHSGRSGGLKVQISADRSDATYSTGQTARLFLTTNEDAYVTVFDIGPSGQVTQLFPNAFQPDNHVLAEQTVEIAGGGTGAHIQISGPVGIELVKIIASSKPLPVFDRDKLSGSGAFRALDGGVSVLRRDLSVAANDPGDNGRKMSTSNFFLRTVDPQDKKAVPGQGAGSAK